MVIDAGGYLHISYGQTIILGIKCVETWFTTLKFNFFYNTCRGISNNLRLTA